MPVVRRLFVSYRRGAFFRNGTAVERAMKPLRSPFTSSLTP